MARSNLFSDLEIAAFRAGITPRTKESIAWFKQKAGQLGKITGGTIFRDEQVKMQASLRNPLGNMYMFYYNEKHREKLPYFDAFPLVVITSLAEGGFYGLNLHYLPPRVRAIFLDKLNDTASNQKFNSTTRFKITYKLLMATRNYKYFKPCFKHYLSANVTSDIMKVNAAEWNIAIFLQTANFKKASVGTVWADSARKY